MTLVKYVTEGGHGWHPLGSCLEWSDHEHHGLTVHYAGEVTWLPSVEVARERAARIRTALEDVAPLIVEAYQNRDWDLLGYSDWHSYVVGEFGGPLRLGRDDRKQAVLELRQEGMSTRAIGDALGVHHDTVATDIHELSENRQLPDTIVGLDGRERPAASSMGIHYSSESPEWYTPAHIVQAVVKVLGAIDLDPCADPDRRIPAAAHFTTEDDGLARDWHGRVYMNPPYGREIVTWIDKLADEYLTGRVTEAIALVPARVDTAWWRSLPHRDWVAVTGRLAFSDHENAAPFPSAVCYLGPNTARFREVFSALGDGYARWEAA